jgi:hypothetical protein
MALPLLIPNFDGFTPDILHFVAARYEVAQLFDKVLTSLIGIDESITRTRK